MTPTRVRDCYEIRVVTKLPKCVCCHPDDQDVANKNDDTGLVAKERLSADNCPCGPTDGCYADHYAGKCACCDDCSDDGSCDCNCVLLGQLTQKQQDDGTEKWTADYSYRRFIRPMFMRDPKCLPPKPAVQEMTVEAIEVAELERTVERELLKRPRSKKAKTRL